MSQPTIQFLIILTLTLILQSGCGVAQSTASASPPPVPAAKRPTLDQFGLSTGVFANGSKTAPADPQPVTKVEYVEQHIFNTLNVISEKSQFLEKELLRVLSDNLDISPSSRFTRYFEHQIKGIMVVSETQRTGQFGGVGIKSGELTKLLEQNERTVLELMAVLNTGPEQFVEFNKDATTITEKYGIPLLESAADGNRMDRPALLKAMMARMNGNFAQVKKRMAVGK